MSGINSLSPVVFQSRVSGWNEMLWWTESFNDKSDGRAFDGAEVFCWKNAFPYHAIMVLWDTVFRDFYRDFRDIWCGNLLWIAGTLLLEIQHQRPFWPNMVAETISSHFDCLILCSWAVGRHFIIMFMALFIACALVFLHIWYDKLY